MTKPNRDGDRKRSRWSEAVLCYSPKEPNRQTVRRHYAIWRREHGLPVRCDIEGCQFHAGPMIWNGKALTPILDHSNGNKHDNRPGNLRYVCPSCDAQQKTRGGLNRGRVVEKGEGKYTLRDRESGRLGFNIILKTGHYSWGDQSNEVPPS